MPLTAGATHTVSSSAQVPLSSPAAIVLHIDVPAQLGEDLGTPPRIFDLGRAAVGTAEAWVGAFELQHADQLLWPLPPSCTRLGLTLAQGAAADVTEMLGDLDDPDCAAQVAALQDALAARDQVIADQTAQIADLQAQVDAGGGGGGGQVGPIITNVASTSTPTSLTVTWDTDLPSDSQVEYGTDTSYGQQSALLTALVTAHSVTVGNLAPNTVYHWRPRSAAPMGTVGADHSDTTPADPTLIASADMVAPASGANSVYTTADAIPQASWPIVVSVTNKAAAGGGVLSGPAIQCVAGGGFIGGSFVNDIQPGATWSSGPLAFSTANCGGQVKVTNNSDASHNIPYSVTIRRST